MVVMVCLVCERGVPSRLEYVFWCLPVAHLSAQHDGITDVTTLMLASHVLSHNDMILVAVPHPHEPYN